MGSCRQYSDHIPHIVVTPTRAELDANILAVDLNENLENLESEASTVLDAPTPLVCALVAVVIEELGNNVAISTVDWRLDLGVRSLLNNRGEIRTLNSVEPSLLCVDSGLLELVNEDGWVGNLGGLSHAKQFDQLSAQVQRSHPRRKDAPSHSRAGLGGT